jgi:hypothetical protein
VNVARDPEYLADPENENVYLDEDKAYRLYSSPKLLTRKLRSPPDLQEFIRQHGGSYVAISQADWAKWDDEVERFKQARRFDELIISSKNRPEE